LHSLTAAVQAAFAPQGLLSRAEALFLPREGQTRMALAVAQAIEQRQTLVVEAGTGVGKTYAYLVPALLSGQRVLVSTATRALQDQLSDVENKIAASRRFMNNAAAEYNSATQQFPALLIAGPFGFQPAQMFTLDPAERAEAKDAPKVSFAG